MKNQAGRLPKSVSSIPKFCEWVEQIGNLFRDGDEYESPWFRGSGSQYYELVPGLYRSSQGRLKRADSELRSEFIRRALPMLADRVPRDDWEWYFLMQHYRVPTRLLDWTDSALVALYFAMTSWEGKPHSKRVDPLPTVWALNPFRMNRRTGWEGAVVTEWKPLARYLPEPYFGRALPKLPIAIDPKFVAQRMLVQHSHFTLHGGDTRSLGALAGALRLGDGLLSVTLNFEEAELDFHMQQLALLGVTETTVFPDLEGLANELRIEYGLDAGRKGQD